MKERDPVRQAQLLDRTLRNTVKEEDGKVLVNIYQDVGPHLEYAAKCRRADAEERGAFGKRGELRRTMSLGIGAVYNAASRLGIPLGKMFDPECSRRIWKELKSAEYKGFRTTIDKNI